VTFSGAPTVSLGANQTIDSDEIAFVSDGTKDLILSTSAMTGNASLASHLPILAGWNEYLLIGSEALNDLNVDGFMDFTAILGVGATSSLIASLDVFDEPAPPVVDTPPPGSVQQKIIKALIDHLKDIGLSPSLEIVESVENEYKPRLDQEYLAAQWLVSPTVTRSIGRGRLQYSGILQVTVVYPRNAGVLLATIIADEIVDHFKKGTIIDGDGVRVKINRQPSQATPTPDGAWLRVPVSIIYNCMA
jgi:hypothetical protein